MGRRKGPFRNKAKEKAGKRVVYALIPREGSKVGEAAYKLLNELVEKHHEELTNARIVLAWHLAWKPDVDGRCKLGACKKASDLDRELAPFDFVILLRQEFWIDAQTTDKQRRALLDHELMHATVKVDRDGEPCVDMKGRRVYRLRKHDIEEFADVIQRHGIYKRDLELFFLAARRSKQGNLLDEPARPAAAVPSPEPVATH